MWITLYRLQRKPYTIPFLNVYFIQYAFSVYFWGYAFVLVMQYSTRCLRSACLPLGGDGYEDDHDRQSLKHLPMSHSKRNTTAVPFP